MLGKVTQVVGEGDGSAEHEAIAKADHKIKRHPSAPVISWKSKDG